MMYYCNVTRAFLDNAEPIMKIGHYVLIKWAAVLNAYFLDRSDILDGAALLIGFYCMGPASFISSRMNDV